MGAWRPRWATGWGHTPGLVANNNGLVETCGETEACKQGSQAEPTL